MFELDKEQLDIVAITGIGAEGNRVMLLDNFYKDPESVRRLALKKRDKEVDANNPDEVQEFQEIQQHLRPLFDQLCFDTDFWGLETDLFYYKRAWDKASFMVNYITEEDFLKEPLKIMPTQDSYPQIPSPFQFKLEVYLNKGDEEFGGTDLYSFLGAMTIPKPNLHKWKDEKSFDNMNMQLRSSFAWKVEHCFPTKFNRALLYKTQILSSPELQKGWYRSPATPRMSQILFM